MASGALESLYTVKNFTLVMEFVMIYLDTHLSVSNFINQFFEIIRLTD